MKVWMIARRIRPGREEEFRNAWAVRSKPEGMSDAYLLQRDDDRNEIVSVSFWENPEDLHAYMRSTEAVKRRDRLSRVVEEETFSRTYSAWPIEELRSAGGSRVGLAAVPVLAAAAAGAYFFNRSRRRSRTEVVVEKGRQANKRYLLPLLLTPLGAGLFVALRRLRGGREEEDEWPETWPFASGASTETEAVGYPSPSPRPHQVENGVQSNPGRADQSPQTDARPIPYPARTRSEPSGQQQAQPHAAPSGQAQLVRDVMTPAPETIDYQQDVATAAKRMQELNVGVLPVMAEGQLAGIITDRDLTKALTESKSPEKVQVREVMSEAPITIPPSASLKDAASLMADHQVRRLPVVEGERLVGIISLGDLSVDGAEGSAGRALEEISEPARPQR